MRIPDLGQSIYALGQSVSNLGQNVARYNTQQIQARRTQEVNNGLANVSNDFAVRSRSLFRDFESSMQNFTSSVDMRTADLGTQYQIWKDETRALYAQQYEGDEEMSEAVNQYLDGQFFNLDQQFNTRSEELYDSLVVKETGDQFIQAAEAQNFQGIDAMEAQMITNIENGEQWTFNEQQIRDMANLAREQAVINVIADDTARDDRRTQPRDYAIELRQRHDRNRGPEPDRIRQYTSGKPRWMGEQDTAEPPPDLRHLQERPDHSPTWPGYLRDSVVRPPVRIHRHPDRHLLAQSDRRPDFFFAAANRDRHRHDPIHHRR
jgi:hypothetical protein